MLNESIIKPGDLIRFRINWEHDDDGNVVTRKDDKGWAEGLVVKELPYPDHGNYLVMLGDTRVIISGPDNCYDIEVLQTN